MKLNHFELFYESYANKNEIKVKQSWLVIAIAFQAQQPYGTTVFTWWNNLGARPFLYLYLFIAGSIDSQNSISVQNSSDEFNSTHSSNKILPASMVWQRHCGMCVLLLSFFVWKTVEFIMDFISIELLRRAIERHNVCVRGAIRTELRWVGGVSNCRCI